jgi:hypothetical protein
VLSLQALSLSDVSLVIRIEVAKLPVWSWRHCCREQEGQMTIMPQSQPDAPPPSTVIDGLRATRRCASFWDFGGLHDPLQPSRH